MNKFLLALTVIGSIALSTGVYKLATTTTATPSPYPQAVMDAWSQWKLTHQKLYSSSVHESSRLDAFAANYNQINASNANPEHTFKSGLNKFSDLTTEEFTKAYLKNNSGSIAPEVDPSLAVEDFAAIPDEIDWSAKGAVSGIKDQGQCGSCWAFSTTGALEGLDFLTNGKIRTFSEQQLVDCDKGSLIPFYMPNMGCSGGNMGWAFGYSKARGMMAEGDYPYHAVGGKCQYDASKTIFKNGTYHSVFPLCNSCLKKQVAVQPVSVAIDGSSIQHYVSGVFNASCSIKTNHGVLAVGYGTDNGAQFWKIKNSWGPAWGEKGFVRISKTESIGAGKCGIATRASYPTM